MDEARMSRGWRRLVVIACTLVLAGSVFLVLGVTVWAQEEPVPTEEQPAGSEQQPAETTQEPAQTTQGDGMTIEYWEPEVGTRNVYYINDFMNDIHGNLCRTSQLGYWDALLVYWYRAFIVGFRVYDPPDYSSDFYYNVAAVSDMNPVYFDLEGPWYFNMTTPYKLVEEVIGIHDAPDADQFQEATYAVTQLFIGSGGHRVYLVIYRSNNEIEQTWNEWGYTVEYVDVGENAETTTKDIFHFRSPHDKTMSVPKVIERFPKKVGETGSYDAVYMEGESYSRDLPGIGYEVMAEGQIVLPSGEYDALLIRQDITETFYETTYTRIMYIWFVDGIGTVVFTDSLPNILGPEYGETSSYELSYNKLKWTNDLSLRVLESNSPPTGGK